MVTALLWVVYGVMFCVSFRYVFRATAEDWGSGGLPIDGVDVAMFLFLAALVSFLAPLVLAFALLRNRLGSPERMVRVIGGESSSARTKRLEREAREAEAKIARLERELGVK